MTERGAHPPLADRLAALQATEVCAELQLAETPDGLFASADAGMILFPVGMFLPWQRSAAALAYHWLAGAPLAFSFSADGHDAAALHLGGNADLHQCAAHHLAPQVWHTAESLGAWTLLGRDSDNDEPIERAAANWFPTPRAASVSASPSTPPAKPE